MRLRRWLVPGRNSDVDSYIVLEVTEDDDDNYHWIDLKIADCNRSVSLSFNFKNNRQRAKMLRKLDRFQFVLDQLRETLNEPMA